MATTADFRRGFLRSLYFDARDQALPFATALESALRGEYRAGPGRGRIIASHSGNGRSTTYSVPSGLTNPQDIFTLCSRFLDLHAAVVADLAAAGESAPTDEAVFNRMLADDELHAVTSTTASYVGARDLP